MLYTSSELFFAKYLNTDHGISNNEVFSHRKEVIERLSEAVDDVYEIWKSEEGKEPVEVIRELRRKIESDWRSSRPRRLFDRNVTPPNLLPEIPDSVFMAASRTLAEVSQHHRTKSAVNLPSR